MSINKLISAPEFYYWYLIPTLVSVIITVCTIKYISIKADAKNICITALIILLIGLSQWVLVQIFFLDAYPAYFPHIAILLSGILVIIQALLNQPNKQKMNIG